MEPDPFDLPPPRVGRYEIIGRLGRGAAGTVYQARDPLIGRTLALKLLAPPADVDDAERAEDEERFLREVRVVGALRDPGIVRIHDAGRDEATGRPFLVMEQLEGATIASELRARTNLDPSEVLTIARRLGAALDAVHAVGVIHRDVKPANIRRGLDGLPRLLDFGVARVAGSELTRTGRVLGTPTYLSPEALRAAPLDPRSDLFSLAVVLYECLSGRRPFSGSSLPAVVHAILHDSPPPLSGPGSPFPPSLDRFFARALAKNPDERFPSGAALAEALREGLGLPATEGDPDRTATRGRVAPLPPPGRLQELPELEFEFEPPPTFPTLPTLPSPGPRFEPPGPDRWQRPLCAAAGGLMALAVFALALAIPPPGPGPELRDGVPRGLRPEGTVSVRFDSLLPKGELRLLLGGEPLARWALAREGPSRARRFELSRRLPEGEHRLEADLVGGGLRLRAGRTVQVPAGGQLLLVIVFDPYRKRLRLVEPSRLPPGDPPSGR